MSDILYWLLVTVMAGQVTFTNFNVEESCLEVKAVVERGSQEVYAECVPIRK